MFNGSLFRNAWARLFRAYLISFALSFTTGVLLIVIIGVAPETIFEISTKRISYVFPILEASARYGIDNGLFLFAWNTFGSVITITFLYAAPLFNPHNIALFPQTIRKIFCGRKRMKLLCYLPGCFAIEEESVRRLYVWLMIPWLGMILLGIESGLTVSTASTMSGSYLIGFASLIPHGIIEIPTIAFAGAITFSAHILAKETAGVKRTEELFKIIKNYTNTVPLGRCILIIIAFLLIAGLVEAHITQRILETLMTSSG